MIRIKVCNEGRVLYDLHVNDRFSIICGDSGKGKTHICTMVTGALSSSQFYSIDTFPSTLAVDVILSTPMIDKLPLTAAPGDVYLIDEDVLETYGTQEFYDVIKTIPAYFILFTRELYAGMCSVNSVYTLVKDKGVSRNERFLYVAD